MIAASPKADVSELEALLPASPDAYPQAVDLVRGLVLVIETNPASYRAASFLDDRILGPRDARRLARRQLGHRRQRARRGNLRPLHFIFHTGHVGSTLLSRLLDETGVVLGLREPLPLRTLADAQDVLATLSRSSGRPSSRRCWTCCCGSGPAATTARARSSSRRRATPGARRAACSRPRRTRRRSISACAQSLISPPCSAAPTRRSTCAATARPHVRSLLAGRSLSTAPLHALTPGELAALAPGSPKASPARRRCGRAAGACWRSISTAFWPMCRAGSRG